MQISSLSAVVQHLRTVAERDGVGRADGELLTLFLNKRDNDALAVLVERHAPMVWGVCRRILDHPQDAEDAFQATFLVLVQKARTVIPREMVGNWLHGVAHQTAVRLRVSGAKRGWREVPMDVMPEPALPFRRDEELLTRLDEELSRLPERLRALIVLCDLEGRTRKEVARQLGCPEGTVASGLARARELLAKRMARHGLAVSGVSLAATLSQSMASADLSASVVTSTIQMAYLLSAGKATGAISGRVAMLTQGMLKTMFLKKIVTATMVVLTLGVAIIAGGSLAVGQSEGKPAVAKEVKPQAPAKDVKDEPKAKPAEEKPIADKEYSLKEGEVLKLITAPFPAEREELFKSGGHPFQTADDCLMAVSVDKGKLLRAHPFTNRKSPGSEPGQPLASYLDHGLGLDLSKTSDSQWLLTSTRLDADVVFKKGAKPEDLLAALAKELKAKCEVDAVLEFREADTEVVVISGKHTLNPIGETMGFANASVVDLYATEKTQAPSVIANSRAFPSELAKFIGRPVVDESDLAKNVVLVKTVFHERFPATEKTRVADRDPAKVLKNLPKQTGLKFKLEKRKVRILVVGRSGMEQKPVDPTDKPEKEPFTAWGKEVGGLQLGLVRVPAEKTTFRPGEAMEFIIKVRNVSKEKITLRYGRPESTPSITDANGEEVHVFMPPIISSIVIPTEKVLQPGETLDLYHRKVAVEGAQMGKVEPKGLVGMPTIRVGAGKYKIAFPEFVTPDLVRSTGEVEFEVKDGDEKKLPEQKEPFTAWGKESGGLQAGLGLLPGAKRVYEHGETVTLIVRVRNVGKQAVKFEYVRQFLDENRPTVTDADGKAVPQSRTRMEGFHGPREVNLEPGKEIVLETRMHGAAGSPYALLPEGGGVSSPKAWPLFVGTGKISLHYDAVFGNSSSGKIKLDPDLAKLATGKLELEVGKLELLEAQPKPNVVPLTVKNVRIDDVDEKAGVISMSFGNKEKPTKLMSVPLDKGVRVVASHVFPGVANNLPFDWGHVQQLKGKVVSVRLTPTDNGLAVVSISAGND